MTTITVLGSGNVARALAGTLCDAGHQVVVGSRDPRTTAADWAGSAPRVTGLHEAAASAEVVINATPGAVSLALLTGLAGHLAGKVLVDVANATATDSAGFASALLYPGGSLAEEIQRALPDVRVVKTLNTLHDSVMADPAALAVPPTAFMSGNDAAAKEVVGGLLADLGWPAEWIVDLGDVRSARVPEAFVLMVGSLVRALGPVPFGMAIAR
ncbi:NADPH-dependent F420 reductase [Streptomyces subrutilus]|uniref:NADP oxidoreductase n=1 Tax=Streptomyces subrutilus TaxID=36818 RepID=A0A5P2UZL1_9ACTN|nr:NAD(P)-binding domain-containing protein [Streptomyces subrutilus]QEU82207.1 NADP oxidoreductase [Streptomyces subrutilus]WSJ28311.1 NAD(P)-binding domain-containing protein [Streptomyces subrutilus]GGZ92159.1 NADP oxidoreductase [Streptomyces subrutilus]